MRELEKTLRTEQSTLDQPRQPGVLVGNLGEPIRLTGVKLVGVAAKSARPPGKVEVWTRLALTSDDRLFHRVVENLTSSIMHYVEQAGRAVRLDRADTVLLVIRPDDSAELRVDTAAKMLKVLVKREVAFGSAVFEEDIADLIGMTFPLVQIGPTDRIVCIFRQSWRLALFFDFNLAGNLPLDEVTRTLGTLYRSLKYRHLYDTVADEAVFGRLLEAGWFPFVEIIGRDFRELANCCEAGLELHDAETSLIAKFGPERLERILARWVAKPHFAPKERLLRSAVNAFKSHDPVATIKIVLTEIEGVLSQAYRIAHGRGSRIKKLLEFAVASAEQKTGAGDTLLLSAAFARYLTTYTFAAFDPTGPTGTAGSRHAVGHGAASADSYTEVRALQTLLTLDQIAFYT